MADEEPPKDVSLPSKEKGEGADSGASGNAASGVVRLKSASSHGMETSIFKFTDVNFTVGSGDKKKNILTDVSGVVKFGRVLAIMGPSGAGKTTLINALTLNAQYGVATGSVKLNGLPFTADFFKEHSYVVQQQDKHWPYLTTRETLKYATQLYSVVHKNEEDVLVNEIIQKMGLNVCADTMAARLSGGQRRRLSIGLALVKQPRVLFLDEPTSGLDAASSEAIMREIVRVAKEENLITICTIHQPSTKVYNNFDQVMIMSRGRVAYAGDVTDALPYFESIGYPIPSETNPAEFFLDLVNSDFSDESFVTKILDDWEEKGKGVQSSHHSVTREEQADGVVNLENKAILPQILILFRRHYTLIIRDSILYIGRAFVFLMANMVFALVYLKARQNKQEYLMNMFWVSIWFVAVPTQLGVVAVYALNDEFKSLIRETKNGMLSGVSYVFAKSCLSLPIMYLFALFALGLPFFATLAAPSEAFKWCPLMFFAACFNFESVGECLSVWFDDPILGMLMYMNYWFASFLFGGFLIPLEDMYYPFEVFYYIMPYSYYVRTFVYNYFAYTQFDSCDPKQNPEQLVCIPSSSANSTTVDGTIVLEYFSNVFPLLSSNDSSVQDFATVMAIGAFYKIFYIAGVIWKTSRSSKFVAA